MNDMTAPPRTSPGSASGSSESGIDRLFRKLTSRYGKHWLAMWEGCELASVKADWRDALRGFKGDEIQRGLDSCDAKPFPPTLPEFKALCRPPIDYQTAFHEAQRNQERRDTGKSVTWSSKAVFWASVSFGGVELRNATWSRDRGRWTDTLNAILDDERESGLPDIPAAAPALPAPGRSSIDPEEAKRRINTAASGITSPRDPKAWARKILANPGAYPDIARRGAEVALGVAA